MRMVAATILVGVLTLLAACSAAAPTPTNPTPSLAPPPRPNAPANPKGTLPPWDPADPAVAELVGTRWIFDVFWDPGSPPIAVPPPQAEGSQRAVVDFRPNGMASGNAFCNNFHGASYRVGAGRALTISSAPSTKSPGMIITAAACPGGVMEADGRFIDGLLEARRYELAGGRLTLLDGSGRPLMTLVADPARLPPATTPTPGGR
jgi:heat shock protein HslJ